jgi:hypothetical protein
MSVLDSELSIGEIVSDLEEFNLALGDNYDEEDTELVDMAKKLLENLIKINDNTSCFHSINVEAKIKIIGSITKYKVIMTPNTGLMFTCTSCCSKKKRQKKHDTMCALTTVHLIEAMYLAQVYDVKYKCDSIIKECHDSQKFADILRQVSSTTSIFEIKNTMESKSLSKEKLSVLLSRLETYKEEFLSAKSGESTSAKATPTRFRNVKVSLASNPSSSSSYVSYKKANKMLYDTASFGTSLLLFKIDEKLKTIEGLMKTLQEIRAAEVTELDLLEVNSFTYNLIDEQVLMQTKGDSEQIDGVIHAKLVGASFEWSELKARVSSDSFLSTYFGSADDDIENLFSSVSFMSTPVGIGSNIVPKSTSLHKDIIKKGTSKNVSDFFNNIKLPHNKKPHQDSSDDEPPIYNLKTQKPIDTKPLENNSKLASLKKAASGAKQYSSGDSLSPKTSHNKKLATTFEPSSSPPPAANLPQPPPAESFTLDVIDFEEVPTTSSAALLSDSSSDSALPTSFSTARKANHNRTRSNNHNSNNKTNSIFSTKFNSKLNQMSGSISRTASKASAKVSETKEKVSEKVSKSAPQRILKNSYTSLKNKS